MQGRSGTLSRAPQQADDLAGRHELALLDLDHRQVGILSQKGPLVQPDLLPLLPSRPTQRNVPVAAARTGVYLGALMSIPV